MFPFFYVLEVLTQLMENEKCLDLAEVEYVMLMPNHAQPCPDRILPQRVPWIDAGGTQGWDAGGTRGGHEIGRFQGT